MTTKWSHLPNAKYIDLVIESIKANPEQWDAAYNTACNAAYNAARNAAWTAARNAAYNTARNAACNAAYNAARSAAWNAIAALIAYNDCAHMLDSDPDDLRILSKLGSHAATLMIPASIAFKSIREKQVVVL